MKKIYHLFALSILIYSFPSMSMNCPLAAAKLSETLKEDFMTITRNNRNLDSISMILPTADNRQIAQVRFKYYSDTKANMPFGGSVWFLGEEVAVIKGKGSDYSVYNCDKSKIAKIKITNDNSVAREIVISDVLDRPLLVLKNRELSVLSGENEKLVELKHSMHTNLVHANLAKNIKIDARLLMIALHLQSLN